NRVNVFLGDLRGQADAARLPGESLSDAVRRLITVGLAHATTPEEFQVGDNAGLEYSDPPLVHVAGSAERTRSA
ncbi:MAG TPA: hypothetical protein VK586_21680, partial [Streptosporangiaceae bacterium]|nr:hypothetical protein [Streptosporangiaceae bacterium]